MYESFYGFTEKPFQLNPDPQFYFDSRQHRRAMAFVEYGLHQSEGFIVITGEIGAGKTTLVRSLLANLDPTQVVAANLVSTQLDADDTLRMIAAAFGVRTRDLAKSEVLLNLEGLLASHAQQGKRCLLIVDEAQNLAPRAIEELRMLSNFQLGTHALLQSFLVGQPEFRLILQNPEMNQLRQRVIAACHIGPLDADDTRHYIEHRLKRVGWKEVPLIMQEAFDVIFAATGGVPRRINLLCDRLLLSGYLTDKRVFNAACVNEVVAEIDGETLVPAAMKRRASDRVPDAIVAAADKAILDVAYSHRGSEAHPEGKTYNVIAHPEGDRLDAKLQDVEHAMQDIGASLARIERGNQATLTLFRRFLDWVQTRDRSPGGPP
jgi:putative secretion ATPase (PEP-CTERM system associated)